MLSGIATDYFEIHFAQRYMDSVYLDSMITRGKVLFDNYMKQHARERKNDYVKILQRAKGMLPANDFYLMFSFAQKLNREIRFIRINGEKNKSYLALYDTLGASENAEDIYKVNFFGDSDEVRDPDPV